MNPSLLFRACVCAAAMTTLAGCHSSPAPPAFSAPQTSAGVVAGSAGQSVTAPLLPDPHLTPGATLDVTVKDIRVPGYAHSVRDVPQEVKRQVYAEYGIERHQPRAYEVDHLISLELGGSNSIKNLWPQSYLTQPWNAHVKDDLENKLHDLVCAGQVPLATAQHDIAANWITAYQKYFHTPLPLPGGYRRRHHGGGDAFDSSAPVSSAPDGSPPVAPDGSADGQVWVNTRSGKYFLPGSDYYGRTKQGRYMTEAQAIQQGYAAARSR